MTQLLNPIAATTMTIIINGEPKRVAAGMTIAALVADIGLNPKKVAVEHNMDIAPRSTLANVLLQDGDVLEIVHFVGGG